MQAFKSRLLAVKTGAVMALLCATVLTALPTAAEAKDFSKSVSATGKNGWNTIANLQNNGRRLCDRQGANFVTLKGTKLSKNGRSGHSTAVCRAIVVQPLPI